MKKPSALFLILILWCILYIPFIQTIPYLDGNIDFLKSHDMYGGGLNDYLYNWPSVHPPFKFFLTSLAYGVGGFSIAAFNILGLLVGAAGIISLYILVNKMFGRLIAGITTVLLAIHPLYIANALNSLNDFVVTVFVLLSLLFYYQKKQALYILSASCLVLTKETGILLPLSVLSIEFLANCAAYYKHKKTTLIYFSLYTIPCFVFIFWLFFLKLIHVQPWSDWIFAPTAKQGAFATVIYNLTTGNLFNMYAYRQWMQVFVLNFNWVFTGVSMLGACLFCIRHYKRKQKLSVLLECTQKRKTILVMFLFFLTYCLTVLSLQTFTVPRYTLPLAPFLLLTASTACFYIHRLYKTIFIFCVASVICIGIVRLFISIDPISHAIWGTSIVYNEIVYGTNDNVGGSDSLTYNMQYFFIASKRSHELRNTNHKNIIKSQDCRWLFRDSDNEAKTLQIIGIKTLPACKEYEL